MAYRSLKIWAIPVWTKWKPWKSGRVGKTLRCCVGAVALLKRDLLSWTGSAVRMISQGAMDASKLVGESQSEEHPAVSLFREYLRIETVHPDPDYGKGFSASCCMWWLLKITVLSRTEYEPHIIVSL